MSGSAGGQQASSAGESVILEEDEGVAAPDSPPCSDAGSATIALPMRIAGRLPPVTPGRTIQPLADVELLRRVIDGLKQM